MTAPTDAEVVAILEAAATRLLERVRPAAEALGVDLIPRLAAAAREEAAP